MLVNAELEIGKGSNTPSLAFPSMLNNRSQIGILRQPIQALPGRG
jgi:hypothetical protein